MATHPEAISIARRVMAETDSVAEALGMQGPKKIRSHRPSILQDLESGLPMELDRVIGVVIELENKLGTPMPQTKALYTCASLLNQIGPNA